MWPKVRNWLAALGVGILGAFALYVYGKKRGEQEARVRESAREGEAAVDSMDDAEVRRTGEKFVR